MMLFHILQLAIDFAWLVALAALIAIVRLHRDRISRLESHVKAFVTGKMQCPNCGGPADVVGYSRHFRSPLLYCPICNVRPDDDRLTVAPGP